MENNASIAINKIADVCVLSQNQVTVSTPVWKQNTREPLCLLRFTLIFSAARAKSLFSARHIRYELTCKRTVTFRGNFLFPCGYQTALACARIAQLQSQVSFVKKKFIYNNSNYNTN